MAFLVNTNLKSLYAQRQTSDHQSKVSKAMEKMASGLELNRSADGSAGLGIANRMTATIKANSVAVRNINDGMSLAQTADSALGNIGNLLQRARELAVQSGDGALSKDDRAMLNHEFRETLGTIDHLANTTQIFDIYPLKGKPAQPVVVKQSPAPPPAPAPTPAPTPAPVPMPAPAPVSPPPALGSTQSLDGVLGNGVTKYQNASGIKPIGYVPVGTSNLKIDMYSYGADDDIQIFTADGKQLVGTPLGDSVWTVNSVTTQADMKSAVLKPDYGFAAGAAYDSSAMLNGATAFSDPSKGSYSPPLAMNYNGMTIGYSGDGFSANYRERVSIDKVTEPLIIVIAGSGVHDITAAWEAMPNTPPEPPAVPQPPAIPEQPSIPVLPVPPAVPEQTPSENPSTPKPSIKVTQESVNITVGASYGQDIQQIAIGLTPADTAALKLEDTYIDPLDRVAQALDDLDSALNMVGQYRAKYGASLNTLERTGVQVMVGTENLSASRSVVMDADYAKLASELAREKILMDASTAMQAQANAEPDVVLQLLSSFK